MIIYIVWLNIPFVAELIIHSFKINIPIRFAEECSYEYLENDKVYVGPIDSSQNAIERLKENNDSFEIGGSNWNKTIAEYKAIESLSEGWYVHVYYDDNICCKDFFISQDGYLMPSINHPC